MSKLTPSGTPRRRPTPTHKVIPLVAREPATAYASKEPARVMTFIGLPTRSSSRSGDSSDQFIQLIRKGIPKKSIDTILDRTGMSEADLARFLHVSLRTIQRRAPDELLDPSQSERLIELARLYTRGESVFGDLAGFIDWMETAIPALGQKAPHTFLDTSIGISILMDELGRIEHGIFS